MTKRITAITMALLVCAIVTGVIVHWVEDGRRRADLASTRSACMREARVARGLSFDAAEVEFRALQSIVDLPMDATARSTISERMVFCVMIMEHCVKQGVVVTRERPADGFEEHTVTAEWIRPYVDTVSAYPEWSRRRELVIGVLMKASG